MSVGEFFCNDHTHFEAAGAARIAGLVARAVREQQLRASRAGGSWLRPILAGASAFALAVPVAFFLCLPYMLD